VVEILNIEMENSSAAHVRHIYEFNNFRL